jgi:hypothetical protein
MRRYSYESLCKGEIRLITLKPRSFSESLLVSVHSTPLSAAKDQYETLSYTWGDTTVLHDLHCSNGDCLNITSNLQDALNDLRLETDPRRLWVDAICIDQENHDERCDQVSMMRQIYQNAKNTIAYLGKEDNDSALVARYLNALTGREMQRVANIINMVTFNPSTLAGHIPESSQDLVLMALNSLGDGEDPFEGFDPTVTKRAIVSFLCRPWFQRVWIIQEFVVSKNVIMVCGTEPCDFHSFLPAFCYAFENSRVTWSDAIKGPQRKDFYLGLSQMLKLLDTRKTFQKENNDGVPLHTLLQEYRTSLATIHLDKIYALTGLSREKVDLKPDYKKSKQELYLQIANYYLEIDYGEQILVEAARSDRTTTPDMPSWVPDWSEAPTRTNFSNIISASGWFFKAGEAKSHKGPKATFHIHSCALKTRGAVIQTVGALGNVNPDRVKERHNTSWLMTLINYIQITQDKFTKYDDIPAQYPTGEDMRAVGAAVLVAGQASNPTKFGKVHKDYAFDIMIEFELDELTGDENDAAAIKEVRKLNNDAPYAVRNMSRAVWGRRLSISYSDDKGVYWGLVPVSTQLGDKICVLQCCAVPYVLPEVDGHYILVGDRYIHGIMQGEALEKGLEMHDIEIY